MCRRTMVLLAAVLLQGKARGQTVRAAVDCSAGRLAGAERETCASPDLMRLTADVDQLTARLEATLVGRDRDALIDTERPFRVERNDCQNLASGEHQCVERLLRGRLDALNAAATAPASIVNEIGRYTFWNLPDFVRWDRELLGKRVHVWGCMALDPGLTPASRIHGTIHDCSATGNAPSVPALFRSMTEERATWFYDAKHPGGYWEGVVERRDSSFVLAQIEP